MFTQITAGLTQMLTWLGSVISSILDNDGALNALLPVLVLSVTGSLIGFGVRMIRSLTWGL